MISTIKVFVMAPFYGAAAVAFSLMSYAVGPDLEEQFFPIITDQSYKNPSRTADRACWDWTYTKRRQVTLVRKALYIERPDEIRYPVEELRPDLGIPSNDSTTAKAGERRTIPECVIIPPAIRSLPTFKVAGVNVYRPFHGLYNLAQPIEPVLIDIPPPAPEPATVVAQ